MKQEVNIKETYKFIHHAFARGCDTALHLLQKAEDFVKEKNISEDEILSAKLAPDMFDFKKQIQVFTDNAAGGIARPAGLEKPNMPDTETTITELIARTQKTKDFILSVNPDEVSGIETRNIKLGWMPGGTYFEPHTYVADFIMQNTFFHLVIAYGILRNKGLQIGKQDFTGQLEMKQDQ